MNERLVCEVANRRNSRIVILNLLEVTHIVKSKNPASVMAFSGSANCGNVILPYLIKGGLKVNAGEYKKIFTNINVSLDQKD